MYPQSWFWTVERLWEQAGADLPDPMVSRDFEKIRDFYPMSGALRNFTGLYLCERLSPQLGKSPVFTDENGRRYCGLNHSEVAFDRFGKPIYLVDNHHLALIAFAEVTAVLGSPLPILHIDAHRDDARFPFAIPRIKPENVVEIINLCRVSDYLDAAAKGGITGKLTTMTQSREFEGAELPASDFVLNLDLDIFGEEGSAVDMRLKIRVIRAAWQRASVIVMATSPGFIDQETAFLLVKILCAKSFDDRNDHRIKPNKRATKLTREEQKGIIK